VPKAIALDGDKPRRRRGGSVAVEQTAERGLAARILLHSPKDTVAGAIAFAAVAAIIVNATFLQAGRHPSPMFGGSITMSIAPASPLPRPRPIEADARSPEARLAEARPAETKPADARPFEPKTLEAKSIDSRPVETRPEARPADPGHAIKGPAASTAASANVPRPPAPIPAPSRNDPVGELITTTSHRVASVQRTLTEFGYGQLKPTGTVGSDTQVAIQKFERDRKLPVTGQISDRLVRELGAMTGRPIE
jgi:hypothetical protein